MVPVSVSAFPHTGQRIISREWEGKGRFTVSQPIIGIFKFSNPLLDVLTETFEGNDVVSHPAQCIQHLIMSLTVIPDVSGNFNQVSVVCSSLKVEALGEDLLN